MITLANLALIAARLSSLQLYEAASLGVGSKTRLPSREPRNFRLLGPTSRSGTDAGYRLYISRPTLWNRAPPGG